MGIKTRGGNLKVPLVNIATIKVGKTVIPPIEIGDIVGNRKPISEHAITVAEKTKLKSRPVGRKKLVARRPRRGKVEEYDECLIESINLIRRIKRMKKSETEKNETEVPKTIADKVLQVIVSMEKTEFDTNFLRQEVLKRYPDLQNSVKNNLINAPLNSIFNQLQKKGIFFA
ncbi:MAG TPA: hypothetical protein PLB52_00100 [Candidatus Moranbacteria bacterium]|nr:hypothetical protein [Candidatus Moranbacteria bacterium]